MRHRSRQLALSQHMVSKASILPVELIAELVRIRSPIRFNTL